MESGGLDLKVAFSGTAAPECSVTDASNNWPPSQEWDVSSGVSAGPAIGWVAGMEPLTPLLRYIVDLSTLMDHTWQSVATERYQNSRGIPHPESLICRSLTSAHASKLACDGKSPLSAAVRRLEPKRLADLAQSGRASSQNPISGAAVLVEMVESRCLPVPICRLRPSRLGLVQGVPCPQRTKTVRPRAFDEECLLREGSQRKARSAGFTSTGLAAESPSRRARPGIRTNCSC